MAEAQRSVLVNVPQDKFYAVITDYESYSKFIPEMRSVKILKTAGNIQQVTFEIELQVLAFTKRLHYTLEFNNDPPNGMRWHLIESNLLKGNNGGWALKPAADGKKTDATYRIELTLGPLVPKAVSSFLAEQSLPKLLGQFKDRAESLGA